jgi:RpiB/LacA/LacB family sugar-phosphate isomerase
MDFRIVIGSDHGGFELKKKLVSFLTKKGYDVCDMGTCSMESCDYPDYAFKVAQAVAQGDYERGIVVCTSGIGVSICANKVKGIRAALCTSVEQAILSRQHNDSNVLALGSRVTPSDLALAICDVWLTTLFDGGRHERRIDKIKNYENNNL